MARYSWTQAVCETDWERRNGNRDPIRLKDPDTEICCDCGNPTASGIYIRADPASVQFPRLKEGDD